jgi:hypothetical protein
MNREMKEALGRLVLSLGILIFGFAVLNLTAAICSSCWGACVTCRDPKCPAGSAAGSIIIVIGLIGIIWTLAVMGSIDLDGVIRKEFGVAAHAK